ncbi:MAG: radical SAM protein [Acidobacteriota bacterium]
MSALAKAAVLAGLVRRKLTFFTWNVTNRCNEDCPMCEVIRRPAVDLTIAEAQRILTEFRRAGFMSLGITGGEPFFRPDIHDLLDVVDATGLQYTIATNGVLVDDAAARHVARLRNLLQVAVSIDSLDPHRFEKLRGRPVLGEAIAGLDRLIAARPSGTVKVNFVMSRENQGDVDALLAFVKTKNVFLTIIPVVAGENGMIHRRNDPMFVSAAAERASMAATFDRLAAMRRAGEPIWDSSAYHEMAAGLARGQNPGPCDAGKVMIELRADGGLAVCPDHEAFASLREMPLSRALQMLPSQEASIERCHTETPCLYTCTYGLTAIRKHPARHLMEHARVTRHQKAAARDPAKNG